MWYAQKNDLVGGWIVADRDLPLSEIDFRKDGDPNKRAYVIAECITETDAERIAILLNADDEEAPDGK